jgi:GT2 family glycosyltransferase
VSIIIPTKDRVDLLGRAVESIKARTEYDDYEIVIVDNRSELEETRTYLKQVTERGIARVLPYDQPFNYSAINNFAVRQCTSPIVVLLNNDVEVISPGWLDELVSHAVRPGIGCVGAMLYYPDDRIQHAGVILGINGVAGHMHRLLARGSPGYFSRAALTQNFSVVTAACLAVRRSIYEDVGGLDEKLQVAFNDVDFCLRVLAKGHRNVWTPHAELYHYESATRGLDTEPRHRARFASEVAFMKQRWRSALRTDPAYNPNLSLTSLDFGITSRPRTTKPWLVSPRPSQRGNEAVVFEGKQRNA